MHQMPLYEKRPNVFRSHRLVRMVCLVTSNPSSVMGYWGEEYLLTRLRGRTPKNVPPLTICGIRPHYFFTQMHSLKICNHTPITHGSSSSSSSSPYSRLPLASSLTRSLFHSELKTWLFGKSFPP